MRLRWTHNDSKAQILTRELTMNHIKEIREDAKDFARQLDCNLPPDRIEQLMQDKIEVLIAKQTTAGLLRLWREFVVRELQRVKV
jgi:hypothetical protein